MGMQWTLCKLAYTAVERGAGVLPHILCDLPTKLKLLLLTATSEE